MTNCCHRRLNGKWDSFYLYDKRGDVNGSNDGFPDPSSNSVCLCNHAASIYMSFLFFSMKWFDQSTTIQYNKQVCPAAKWHWSTVQCFKSLAPRNTRNGAQLRDNIWVNRNTDSLPQCRTTTVSLSHPLGLPVFWSPRSPLSSSPFLLPSLPLINSTGPPSDAFMLRPPPTACG